MNNPKHNQYFTFEGRNQIALTDVCTVANDNGGVTVEKVNGSWARLKLANGEYIKAKNNRVITTTSEIDNLDLDSYLWRSFIHVGGSVSFLNK